MVTIKNKLAIDKMAVAGQLLAQIFFDIPSWLTDQLTTEYIDSKIAKQLQANKLVSQTKGYKTYKHSSCISINDEVVHGVPTASKKIKEGDLVKIDVCA